MGLRRHRHFSSDIEAKTRVSGFKFGWERGPCPTI